MTAVTDLMQRSFSFLLFFFRLHLDIPDIAAFRRKEGTITGEAEKGTALTIKTTSTKRAVFDITVVSDRNYLLIYITHDLEYISVVNSV